MSSILILPEGHFLTDRRRMKIVNKPNIFEFLDIREFLSEYYKYRKSQSNKFSYETWANELGIKSRSLLRMVVLGQRQVSAIFAEVLSYGFQFKPAELKYYFLLIDYSQAKSKAQKSFFWKQMLTILGSSHQRKEILEPEFLASHWLPKIQTILSFTDLERTPEKIEEILGLDTGMALKFLEALEKISFAKRESINGEKNTWNSQVGSFKIPEALQSSALKDYYIQSFDDAKKAISLPPEIRKYRSLMLPLSSQEYADLLLRLEDAFQEVLIRYKSDELTGRRLYQLNMNLIPISKKLEETVDSK